MATVVRRVEGVAIDIEAVLEDKDVQRLLSQLIAKGRDLTAAMKRIAAVAYGDIKDIFRVEGRPIKWAPLRPLTIALRRKGRGPVKAWKILRDTGRGFASVTSAHGDGTIYKPRPDSLVIGTSVPYMAKHQTGQGPRTETWQIKEHRVRRHLRVIRFVFGRPIAPRAITVGPYAVRAHPVTFHFGRLPKRVFLQWSEPVIEKAKLILADELSKAVA